MASSLRRNHFIGSKNGIVWFPACVNVAQAKKAGLQTKYKQLLKGYISSAQVLQLGVLAVKSSFVFCRTSVRRKERCHKNL